MPTLYRRAGFDADSGKVRVGSGTTVYSGLEARRWLVRRGTGQLQPGDAFHQSWLDAGITKEEIQETVDAATRWVALEDAWFVAVHCEILGWK